MDMQAYRIREWLQAEGSAQGLSPTMYPTSGTLRWGFVGACVLMEGVKSATSAAASFSNRIFRAWPFNGRGTNHIDAAMLELITQEVFLPAAGHIQGLVELWWLHLGFVAGDAAQTYAATQSAADSQRRLQTWLALATPAWPTRLVLLLAQAQFIAMYTVGHMALPDVMRAISIYMEYGSSQACQALAKRIAQGDLQELGAAQVSPQICAMYGLEAGNLVEVLHVACEEAQQASATSLALLAAHGPMHNVRAPTLELPEKTLAVPGAPRQLGQQDKPGRGLGDIFNSVWAAASPNRQQRRNSHSLPPASETEAPGVPSQTLALARASTVASSHPSDVDDSAMTSAHSGLAAQVRAKKEEPKAPVLSSIGRALSFKRSNGNGNGTGNGNGYRSNGGSRPMSPARSQRSQVQSDLLDSGNLAENTNMLASSHSLREVAEIAANGDIPGGDPALSSKLQGEPAAKAMAAMDKMWTSGSA